MTTGVLSMCPRTLFLRKTANGDQTPLSPNLKSPRSRACKTFRLSTLAESQFSSVQLSSFSQLCPTLCDPMDCSTPGFPVHHQLPKLAQTHVHHVSDAIQPSHPLSSPSRPIFNLFQHQGLFQWTGSSSQVAKVLEYQLQHLETLQTSDSTHSSTQEHYPDILENRWCVKNDHSFG